MRDTLASLQWGLVASYVDLNRNQTVWTQAVKSLPSGPPIAPIATGNDAYNGTFPVGQVSLALLQTMVFVILVCNAKPKHNLWSTLCHQGATFGLTTGSNATADILALESASDVINSVVVTRSLLAMHIHILKLICGIKALLQGSSMMSF